MFSSGSGCRVAPREWVASTDNRRQGWGRSGRSARRGKPLDDRSGVICPPIHGVVIATSSPIGDQAPQAFAAITIRETKNKRTTAQCHRHLHPYHSVRRMAEMPTCILCAALRPDLLYRLTRASAPHIRRRKARGRKATGRPFDCSRNDFLMLLKSKCKKRDAACQRATIVIFCHASGLTVRPTYRAWLRRDLGDGDRGNYHRWITGVGIPNGEGP
jgi:hypothetical protein